MRLFLYFVLLWSCTGVFAASTVSLPNKIYAPLEEIPLDFTFDQCFNSYRLFVITDVPKLEYLDGTWKPVLSSDPLKLIPKLKLRISSADDHKVQIILRFQNIKTGKFVELKPLNLWISGAFAQYIELLNHNILPP